MVQICLPCRREEAFATQRVPEEWQCSGHRERVVDDGNMLKVSAMPWQRAQDIQKRYVDDYENKPQTFAHEEMDGFANMATRHEGDFPLPARHSTGKSEDSRVIAAASERRMDEVNNVMRMFGLNRIPSSKTDSAVKK